MSAGCPLQRNETIFDLNDWKTIGRYGFGNGTSCTAFLRLGDEGVGIEIGAAQRNE
jgi:hypothetical protein